MSKKKKSEIKIRKPVPQKPNKVIESKKDKKKRERPNSRELIEKAYGENKK